MSVKIPLISKKEAAEKPKQTLPIKDIDTIIELENNEFVAVLKVTDPINTDLFGAEDVMAAVVAIQDCCNALQQRAQILVSSERIDIESYLDYLREKSKGAEDAYTLDRIHAKIDFLKSRSLSDSTVLNFYFAVKSQFKKSKEAYEELVDISKTFQEYLLNANMQAHLMQKDEAMRVFYQKLNPTTSMVEPYTSEFNLQNLYPSLIQDNGRSLEMDDMHYEFYTFSYFPDEVNHSWLKRVVNIKANIDLSINLKPGDKSKIITATDRRLQNVESRLLEKLPGSLKKKYESQAKSLDRMMDSLENDSENLFDTTFIVALREKTKEDLNTASKRLRTAISSSKLRSRLLRNKGHFLFWYTLPICYENPDFERKINWSMPSSTLASILPFDSSELQENEGILKGFHATKEAPIIYNRYDKTLFNNPNEIVLGESGSGKSFYLKMDMLRQSTSGASKRLFVIDPEREFFLPNAKRIIFKLGSEFATNPFHIRSTIIDSDNNMEDGKNDVGQYLRRKIGETMSFFKWIMPSLENMPDKKAQLIQGISDAYAQKGLNFESTKLPNEFPTLSDLKESLNSLFGQEAQWLVDSMYPYIDGPYASMFNGQTNWDFNSKITVLDIHEISDDIKKPLMDLLIKDIWEEHKIDRTELKGFYVDEAWLLADENNPQTMAFLREVAKRIRKYGGFLTTATQNVDDFLTIGKYGSAIFKNAHFKTFMRLDEKDVDELKRFMTFSVKELKVLGMTKEKGRCIHMASSKRIEMQTRASRDELEIIDPEEAKKLVVA